MSWRVFKQPTGQYAIWSSVVDDFIVVDCTREDVVAEFVEAAERLAIERAEVALRRANGELPYNQLGPQTFDECIERIRELHGTPESLKMLRLG